MLNSEECIRVFMDNSPDAIWICDRDLKYVFINRIGALWLKRDVSEIIGKSHVDLFHPEVAKRQEEILRGIFATGEAFEDDFFHTVGSEEKWQNVRILPMLDNDHRIFACMGIVRDITEHKRALESIEQNQKQLTNAMDLARAGHWEFDVATRKFSFNDRIFALYATTAEREGGYQIAAEDFANNFILPEDVPFVMGEIEQAIADPDQIGTMEIEHRILRRDGQIRHVSVRSTVVKDGQNRIIKTRGIIQDITERKQNEEMQRFHALLLEHMAEGIMLAQKKDQSIVYANPAFERMFGYSSGELLGKQTWILDVPNNSQQKKISQDIAISMESTGSWHGKLRNVRKDGSLFWGSVTITGFKHPLYGDVGIAVQEDISARMDMEIERDRLASAIAQSGEIVIITDIEGNIQYVNPTFEAVTGYSREDAVGKNPRFLKGGTHNLDFYRHLWDTITAGQTWRGQLVNRKKDGTFYSEAATISPMRDASGEIVNFVAVKQDMTEYLKLREDSEKLKVQLLQSQKMEAVGRLAGGVAHDFNNMLSVILGYTELILTMTDSSNSIYSDLQEIYQAAERSKILTKQLLGFARKQTIAPKILGLNETIEGMLKMLRRLIGEDLELVWKPDPMLWSIRMDPSQIDQILVNLCVNSRDAIDKPGAIIIETGNVVLDRHFCGIAEGPVFGEYAMLAVSDTGRGMSKEILDHLFEPFFTTKETGKGTGLGLAMVYGIVRQNNGFIKVYSEIGKGSTFKIYFPRLDAKIESMGERKPEPAKRGNETVLVVEDEEGLLRLTCRMLKRLDYTVLAAKTPSDAIRFAHDNPGKIDLLITDVIMPEMTGRDLATKLVTILPSLKLLFMSGYTANVIAHQGILDEGISFIQKPFSLKGLAAKVREVIDK